MARTSLSRLRSRTVARVSWPPARSWIRQWAPTNPVPPVTKTRAIHLSPMIEADRAKTGASAIFIPTSHFGGPFQMVFPRAKEMLHLKLMFKVKGDFDAHRGTLQKDRDLDLAHSLLREARRASQAEP